MVGIHVVVEVILLEFNADQVRKLEIMYVLSPCILLILYMYTHSRH